MNVLQSPFRKFDTEENVDLGNFLLTYVGKKDKTESYHNDQLAPSFFFYHLFYAVTRP